MKTYQLTDSQLGIYLDAMKDEGTLAYNGPYLLKLPAGVDRARATQAFLDTFAAHPIYSATFVAGPNGPEMRIPDPGEAAACGVSAAAESVGRGIISNWAEQGSTVSNSAGSRQRSVFIIEAL